MLCYHAGPPQANEALAACKAGHRSRRCGPSHTFEGRLNSVRASDQQQTSSWEHAVEYSTWKQYSREAALGSSTVRYLEALSTAGEGNTLKNTACPGPPELSHATDLRQGSQTDWLRQCPIASGFEVATIDRY